MKEICTLLVKLYIICSRMQRVNLHARPSIIQVGCPTCCYQVCALDHEREVLQTWITIQSPVLVMCWQQRSLLITIHIISHNADEFIHTNGDLMANGHKVIATMANMDIRCIQGFSKKDASLNYIWADISLSGCQFQSEITSFVNGCSPNTGKLCVHQPWLWALLTLMFSMGISELINGQMCMERIHYVDKGLIGTIS